MELGLIDHHFRDFIVDNDTLVGLGLADVYNTEYWQQSLLVAKFDSSGNLLAYNVIVDSLGDFYSIDRSRGKMAKVSDGGYALTSAPLVRDGAVLAKLNRELEVEFVREYRNCRATACGRATSGPPFFPLNQNTSGWFGGVGELSSGSLVAGGFANQGIYFYPWLVKTDANGCIEAPCEPVNAAAGPALSDTEPLLFPNPASGRFYLSWPGRPPGEVRCTLLDAQGGSMARAAPHGGADGI